MEAVVPTPPPLSGGAVDRDLNTRVSDAALDAAWRDPRARVLRIKDGTLLPICAREGVSAALYLLPTAGPRTAAHYYLGRNSNTPVFACAAHTNDGYPNPPCGWQPITTVSDTLTAAELELITIALALIGWHHSMSCSTLTHPPTTAAHGGWMRLDARNGEHFPRTDPAVIMTVEHDNRILLGTNKLWQEGRFSLLAGFVEAGESAEHTVVREVREEAGVSVHQLRYVASQPWPFPRSLMLGFRTQLAIGEDPAALRPDPTEIAELRWFTRAELRSPTAGVLLPGKLSIARWLIDLWLAEGDSMTDLRPGDAS